MPLDTSLFGPAVDAANRYGVPPDLFLQQINQESGFDPYAVNPRSGATGIAQIKPSTAANPGYGIAPVDPNDPLASLDFAAHYDSVLYGQTGSWSDTLTRYGTGTDNPAGEIASSLDGSGTGLGSPGGMTPASFLPDWLDPGCLFGGFLFGGACGGVDQKPFTQQPLTSKVTGSWNQWFVRAAVVLFALIFVFVGLNGFIRTGKL